MVQFTDLCCWILHYFSFFTLVSENFSWKKINISRLFYKSRDLATLISQAAGTHGLSVRSDLLCLTQAPHSSPSFPNTSMHAKCHTSLWWGLLYPWPYRLFVLVLPVNTVKSMVKKELLPSELLCKELEGLGETVTSLWALAGSVRKRLVPPCGAWISKFNVFNRHLPSWNTKFRT